MMLLSISDIHVLIRLRVNKCDWTPYKEREISDDEYRQNVISLNKNEILVLLINNNQIKTVNKVYINILHTLAQAYSDFISLLDFQTDI